MKRFLALFLALPLSTLALCQGDAGGTPKTGRVPDSDTAMKVAERVLDSVYGKKQIESEKPLIATLKADVWTVHGTLTCPDGKGGVTTSCVGGVAVVRISRKNGRVLSVEHGM